MKKRDTRFKPGVSGNESTKWKTGQSGNPAGVSKLRVDFERTFTETLITAGSAEEAAQLLWAAARNKEPWAIQELCRRFAPETRSLRLVHEVDNEAIDYTKLTDQQIEQIDAILERAIAKPPKPEGGESPTPAL